jgi:hypothetical protein
MFSRINKNQVIMTDSKNNLQLSVFMRIYKQNRGK